jgi:hypothetical protein
MKTIRNFLYLFLFCFLFLVSCQQDTFTQNNSLTSYANPSDLEYYDLYNARENARATTGVPTVQTGGLPPYYEIVSARTEDGTILDDTYMDDVTIINPIEETKPLGEDNWYIFKGDTIKTYTAINSKNAGVIEIDDNNKFGIGNYYFTVKVSTEIDGTPYETVFEDVFHLNVGPSLVTNLFYSPVAQNIVVGSGSTTTQPYLITGNQDVSFALANEEEKLNIDTETGVISLKEGYTTVENDTLYPKVIVTSNISQETTEFEGNSFLMLVASNSPVELPKSTNYFFYPTLQSENLLYGYEKQITAPGDVAAASTWKRGNQPPAMADAERPDDVQGKNKTLLTQMNTGDWKAHVSWVVMKTQDLSNFRLGYDLSAVFYTMNQYVLYMPDGSTPTEMEIYYSTNYNNDINDVVNENVNEADWTQINDQITCQIDGQTNTFLGTPYPGQNNGNLDPDGKKDPTKNNYGKWVRCEFDLTPFKEEKKFTLAFRLNSYYGAEYPNGIKNVGTSGQARPGTYFISDVHFKATEE